MKKLILFIATLFVFVQVNAQQVPEKFVDDLDKISTQYSRDMHSFLRTLAPTTQQFDAQQKTQYCSIVANYVNDFYSLVDKNRVVLPASDANMTKLDIIDRVKQSKEMQILEKYNIQCDLN